MKVALAGDTMLGRGVAEAIREASTALFASEVIAAAAEADLFMLNLECCISERGARWPSPEKPFFFRAPPVAAELLANAGVGLVTLANNHALDYGEDALLDTFGHLQAVGIPWAGAGADLRSARAPARLRVGGEPLAVLAFADHPSEFAARESSPGIAYADLQSSVPSWLSAAIEALASESTVMAAPHWGPNMVSEPLPYVRDAARQLVRSGAALVAGHSAHVFHGVGPRVLFDLGDFLDDYAVDRRLRNDLGLLFLVTIERGEPTLIEALPLKLEYCHTRLARGEEAEWIAQRFRRACEALGTEPVLSEERVTLRLGRA